MIAVLWIFTGQALAMFAMPCHWQSAVITHSNHNQDFHAHHHHRMSVSDSDAEISTTTILDCCKTKGHCLSAGFMQAITNSALFILLTRSSSKENSNYLRVIAFQPIFGHFRPPIFRWYRIVASIFWDVIYDERSLLLHLLIWNLPASFCLIIATRQVFRACY